MSRVGVVMGSSSDEPVVSETVKVLEDLGIDYEVRVMSAHRDPRP
jgi:5-(carboxyamino)imidazole ribonucleotide mutase